MATAQAHIRTQSISRRRTRPAFRWSMYRPTTHRWGERSRAHYMVYAQPQTQGVGERYVGMIARPPQGGGFLAYPVTAHGFTRHKPIGHYKTREDASYALAFHLTKYKFGRDIIRPLGVLKKWMQQKGK